MNYFLCSAKVLDKKRLAADKMSDEQRTKVAKEFEDIGNKFHSGYWKNIKDTGYNDLNTFDFLYFKATGMPFDPTNWGPTMIDARKFKIRIDRFNKNLVNKEGWISSFFKLPRTIMKKLPELMRFQQEMIYETSFFRKNTFAGNKRVNVMLKTFKDIASELGGNTKEYASIEKALDAAKVKGDDVAKNKLMKKKLEYLKAGSGRAYLGLMKALQGADIETMHDELPSRKSKANMHKIMGQWRELRNSSARSLVRGMEKIVTLAKGNVRNENLVEKMQSRIRAIKFQEVIDKEGNTIPGEKFKVDEDILKYGFTVEEKNSYMARDSKGQLYVRYRQYMPHYVLGIPKMLYTAEKLFRGGDGESIADLTKAIEKELGSLDNIITRIEQRNETIDTEYHLDPFFFFKKYVSDVAIFNYKTHIKDTFRRAYGDLANNHLAPAKESGNKNSVEMLENMMKMTHDVYDTLHNIDPYRDTTGNNFMRFMTSLTYFRLLGGNFRSAARNATQRIHEIHNFGLSGVMQANAYYSKSGGAEQNVEMVNRQLKEYGLLWFSGKNVRHKLLDSLASEGTGISEASRGALGESFVADYGLKVTKDGEIVQDHATASRQIAQTAAKVAEKSAVLHRLVEDWNRTNTFKVAFALVHENLGKMSPEWLQNQSGKKDPKAVGEWKESEAGKMAYNATLDIHYEYAKWAKAKGLQTGAGQFLGQFMHYRFSLFDMMYKWADEAGIAFRAGDFTGQESWRLMRMGMTTAMIGGVFAPLLNTKLSSLFQNDVKETAEIAYKFLSTDRNNEEEMEELDKVTYGQGGWYFLGPNVNFLLSVNEMQDHYFMDETKHNDYLKDIDFLPKEQLNKRFKLMSLVNAQFARSWNYTAPLFYKRGIIDAARMELGFFPDEDIREIRKTAQKWLGRNIHPSLGVRHKKKGKPRKTPLSEEEKRAAISSLSTIT